MTPDPTVEELVERLRTARERSGGGTLLDRLRANNRRVDLGYLGGPAFWRRIGHDPEADVIDAAEAEAEPVRRERKRRPLIFRERDVSRALIAHMKAGLGVKRTEIDPHTGRIIVIVGEPEHTDLAPDETPKTLRELI